MASVARTVKGVVGVGCIAALAAACTSEMDSTESVGSSSQALIQSQCARNVVKAFPGDFSTSCNLVSTYTTVTDADISLNQVRAQSYFSYLLGGPVPPASLTIGATTYAVRDKYFFGSGGPDGRSTSAKLCALRSGIARGSVAISNVGSDTLCSATVGVYKMWGTLDNSDCNGVLGLPAGSSISATGAVLWIAQSIEADRNWCPLSGTGAGSDTLPSFFKVSTGASDGSVNIDPEPVTLSASLGTSSGATAAANGNDTAAIYSSSTSTPGGPVYRWSSSGGTCGTTLKNYLANKTFGVPCFTNDQTGTQTSKYIRKDPADTTGNRCICLTP